MLAALEGVEVGEVNTWCLHVKPSMGAAVGFNAVLAGYNANGAPV
jgi:hypothetical protein